MNINEESRKHPNNLIPCVCVFFFVLFFSFGTSSFLICIKYCCYIFFANAIATADGSEGSVCGGGGANIAAYKHKHQFIAKLKLNYRFIGLCHCARYPLETYSSKLKWF